MRDLLIVIVFSPVIYLIVKKTPIGIMCLSVMYFTLPHMSACYFFSLGSYFAIQQKDFVALSRHLCKYAVAVAALSLGTLIALSNILKAAELYILSSMIVAVAVAYRCSERRADCCRYLSKYRRLVYRHKKERYDPSFFLFCYHILPLMILKKIGLSFLAGKAECFWIADYFFNPLITILLGVLLYNYLHKYTQRLLSFITGGR